MSVEAKEVKRYEGGEYAHRTFDKYAGMDILLDKPGEILLLAGTEACARGAIEAGVKVATSYPGSPTTYILDSLSYYARKYNTWAEWSTNEKVGFEVALGAAMCGKRAIHITKNVGMNWIVDPLVNQRGWIFPGALVLAIGDDPEANTTSCEMDARILGQFAEIPILAPSTPQEVKDYTVEAFEMSEALGCPVMVDLTRVLCYGRGKVVLGPINHAKREQPASFDHDFHHYSCNVDPEFLGENLGFLRHLRFHQPGGLWDKILKKVDEFKGHELKLNGEKVGIIAAAGIYALDHHLERLKEDHQNAKHLALGLKEFRGVSIDAEHVETNIIIFNIAGTGMTAHEVTEAMKKKGVLIHPIGKTQIRLVTHLDVSSEDIEIALKVFKKVLGTL
jgi:TPP-dependent indolepyruvate ferredoxin oxidoreductase alpha subunit